MRIELPIATVSEANRRDHWATKARRVKAQRNVAWALCPVYPVPCVVTMTRVAPRALDDDNNVSSMKAVRDSIAKRLGVDDRSPLVEWRYAQAKGRPAAVLVEFAEKGQ